MEFGDYQIVMPGFLEIYCGPMKSGKTKALLDRVDKMSILESDKYIFFRPAMAKRDFESRSSKINVEWIDVDVADPDSIASRVRASHKIVLIDEVQFFDVGMQSATGMMKVVDRLLHYDKNVILGGLDLDFRGEPFKTVSYFMARANYVKKLTAVCDYKGCGKLATRTQRLLEGRPAPYNDTIFMTGDKVAPGNRSYEARCVHHHEIPDRPAVPEFIGLLFPARPVER